VTPPGDVRLSADSTAVVLDSTADLPDAHARHSNWRVVPLYVRVGDDTYRDHVELAAPEFYARLRRGEKASTSQPTPGDFEECFQALDRFDRIICVTVSAKVSGTYESAERAAETIGGGKVAVVDSASASAGEVVLAEAIQRRLERGTDDEEVLAVADRFRRESGLLFTVDTLDYLVRGGRIGKAAGLAGNLLNVKPILTIREGEVEPVKRVRGRAKAFAEFEAQLVAATDDDPGWHVAVAHADAEADAQRLVEMVKRARPRASLDVSTALGPVVGAHAGPGTLGLFWFRDDS
jgi:DegV family protein with EDD domain